MSSVILEIPEETLRALNVSAQEASTQLRLAAAIKLHEAGRLSSGAAARLAGVSRPKFLAALAGYGVDTFHLTSEELRREANLG